MGLAAFFKLASPDVAAARLARCTGDTTRAQCPELKQRERGYIFGPPAPQCGLCHCFVELKTKLANESCPARPSRWGAES